MTSFTVHWSIDLDADTPREAAEQALTIQRDPNSLATVFRVRDQIATHTIDLDAVPAKGD